MMGSAEVMGVVRSVAAVAVLGGFAKGSTFYEDSPAESAVAAVLFREPKSA